MNRLVLPVLLLLMATIATSGCAANRADSVLDRFAQAIGGAQGWSRHSSVRLKREIEVKEMQIRGTEERLGTAAGEMLSTTTIPGIGAFRQGSDGRVHWTEDPINGLRVITGAEEEEARIDATWNAEARLKEVYQSVRAALPPSPPPTGQRYECVELVPKLAKPAIACFDAETHLRVMQTGTHATPQGEVPYRVIFSDWRDVEGVKIPFHEEMVAGPTTLVARILEIKFDEPFDKATFALPDAAAEKK